MSAAAHVPQFDPPTRRQLTNRSDQADPIREAGMSAAPFAAAPASAPRFYRLHITLVLGCRSPFAPRDHRLQPQHFTFDRHLHFIDTKEAWARVQYLRSAGLVHSLEGGAASLADHSIAKRGGNALVYHLPGLLEPHGLVSPASCSRARFSLSAVSRNPIERMCFSALSSAARSCSISRPSVSILAWAWPS